MDRGSGHALVVGGSGMLARLCRRLAGEGWLVSVVGRDPSKLALVAAGFERTHPISVDYEDVERFREELAEASDGSVRYRSPSSGCARGRHNRSSLRPRRWQRRAGSSASSVSPLQLPRTRQRTRSGAAAEAARYQEVRLGAVATTSGHRWLTDAEISDGVHKAIQSGAGDALVGDHAS